jgi:uncharacterized protein YbjQ (UPF0145 family)
MEKSCVSCRKPETASSCGICQGDLCRKCRLFLGDAAFPFLSDVAPELKHAYYCGPCYDEHVEPVKTAYDASLERAKDVNVLYKGSKSTVRYEKKADRETTVSGSPDRDETILRLAFEAARAGYNAVVDVEISSEKVRNHGWQTSSWTGRGTPAEIRSHQLSRLS